MWSNIQPTVSVSSWVTDSIFRVKREIGPNTKINWKRDAQTDQPWHQHAGSEDPPREPHSVVMRQFNRGEPTECDHRGGPVLCEHGRDGKQHVQSTAQITDGQRGLVDTITKYSADFDGLKYAAEE